MIVNIIGSKDQLVNEYRVMLAEKLLNKSDYDIDSEIRTLELLKVIRNHTRFFVFFLGWVGGGLHNIYIHLKNSLLFVDSFWRKQHAEM